MGSAMAALLIADQALIIDLGLFNLFSATD